MLLLLFVCCFFCADKAGKFEGLRPRAEMYLSTAAVREVNEHPVKVTQVFNLNETAFVP